MGTNRRPSTAPRIQKITTSKQLADRESSIDTENDSVHHHSLHSYRAGADDEDEDDASGAACKENAVLDGKDDEGATISRKTTTLLSRITTVEFDESMMVARKERRGLLAQLCLVPEYQDARNLPPTLRRAIVFIIAFCAMLGPMGTSILLPASDDAIRDLGTTITILNVAIGVYLITLGVIPLWWSNLSERHGRRSVYIVSFILYLCFTIGCALANNVNTLIGFRVLSGGCAASVQSVGAGTIGDLYPITKRGAAMGLFYLGPLAGPLLSPIIGGAITSNRRFGWRATQWFLICLSGGCCLLIILFLPETLRKQDNREAIRKILRERRTNKIHKPDEECPKVAEPNLSVDEKDGVHNNTDNNTDNSTGTAEGATVPNDSPNPNILGVPLTNIESIDSQVFDNDEDVNEEEVEHLNKLLTRMSTRRSFAAISAKGDGNKSRKSSVSSCMAKNNKNSKNGAKTANNKNNKNGTNTENNKNNNNSCDTEMSSSDFEKESLSHDADSLNSTKDGEHIAGDYDDNDDDDDDDDEPPIMDAVAPLSRVATTNTISMNKKKRRDSVAQELEKIHALAHGSKFRLFLHYLKIYLYGPLKAFVFMRYPPVFLAMAYSAPCFAALYVQNMTLTYMYSKEPYNFSPVLVGLVYIPNSVTYFIASIWGGKFNDYLLKKKIEKYGIIAPEARFGINVYVAAAILPCSMLITGWCLEYGEQWVTPLIGTALFGFAQMIVIGVTVTYLADCLPGRGATGIALNNFIRMIMAAGVSFATEPLIKAIGTGVLFSICAGVTAALSVLLVIIIKYGDHWRETYDLEKLYDIVDDA